jgi:hypothetical protein
MVQLSATRCYCIAILWVSLVRFATITLYVASQRVIPKVSVYFVIDSVRELLDTPSYILPLGWETRWTDGRTDGFYCLIMRVFSQFMQTAHSTKLYQTTRSIPASHRALNLPVSLASVAGWSPPQPRRPGAVDSRSGIAAGPRRCADPPSRCRNVTLPSVTAENRPAANTTSGLWPTLWSIYPPIDMVPEDISSVFKRTEHEADSLPPSSVKVYSTREYQKLSGLTVWS